MLLFILKPDWDIVPCLDPRIGQQQREVEQAQLGLAQGELGLDLRLDDAWGAKRRNSGDGESQFIQSRKIRTTPVE